MVIFFVRKSPFILFSFLEFLHTSVTFFLYTLYHKRYQSVKDITKRFKDERRGV